MGKVPGDARGKPRNLPIRKYKELLNRWGYYLGRVFFWFKTDVRTQTALEIVSVVAGANDVSDTEALPDLLQDVPVEIEQVSAAGACNKRKCYDTLNKHGAKAQKSGSTQPQRPNAMCVTRIYGRSEKSGVKSGSVRTVTIAGAWPQTQVFSFKTIFGDQSQTNQIDNPFKEFTPKSAIFNRMTHLGMPDSVKVVG